MKRRGVKSVAKWENIEYSMVRTKILPTIKHSFKVSCSFH